MKDIQSNLLFALETYTPQGKEQLLGLANGTTGIAILNFLLAKYTGNEVFYEKGIDLLNFVTDNISYINNLNLENGIAGIGWAIEWLVQNKLLNDTNTDDVLEDIDNEIYRSVTYESDKNLSLLGGVLGKLKYFHIRELSRNFGTHPFRRICHQECIVLLTDDLHERTKKKGLNGQPSEMCKNILTKQCKQNLIDMANIVVQMASISNINRPTVELILYETNKFIDGFISCLLKGIKRCAYKLDVDSYINTLYLSACYSLSGKLYMQEYWRNKGLEMVGELWLLKPEFEKELRKNCNWLAVENLIRFNVSDLKFDVSTDKATNLAAIDARLSGNLGGMLISEISTDSCNLIERWHELIFVK